jgi:hypothetical protein
VVAEGTPPILGSRHPGHSGSSRRDRGSLRSISERAEHATKKYRVKSVSLLAVKR